MKKILWLTVFAALAAGLSGCSSTPEVIVEEVPPTLQETFLLQAKQIVEAGGLAAAGLAESRSLDLALNHATKNGRRELARVLETRIEALQDAFIEETGTDKKDPLFAPFSSTARDITSEYIQNLVASELKYETTNGMVSACALMELDPRIVLDRLTAENKLDDRLQGSRTLKLFKRDVTDYEAFKAGLISPPGE